MKKSYLSTAVTHCFGGHDFDEVELREASDLHEIPVLRPDWITQSVLCKTLLPFSAFGLIHPKQIFSGLKISTSGLSSHDLKCLWSLIVSCGGRFDCELKSDSTHLLVACRDASGSKKYQASLSRQNRIKIVTPDWVTECLRKGQLICAEDFHPRLLIDQAVPTPSATPITSLPPTPILSTAFKFMGLPTILSPQAKSYGQLPTPTTPISSGGREKKRDQLSTPPQPPKLQSSLDQQQEIILKHLTVATQAGK